MYFVHPQIKLSKLLKAKLALMKSPDTEKLVQKLSILFPQKQFIFTDMARGAFRVIVEKLNLQNSEIILPAYICDIFIPILKHYNIKPIFLDIDLKTFNIKIEEIGRKITPRTKAILVSHTYGLPLDVQEIRAATNNRLLIIEDCAHSFGATAGMAGDVSFFSLYKQLPTLRGGMLVCPKNWDVALPKTYFNFRDFISFLNYFWPFAFFFKKFGSEIAPRIPRKEKLSEPAGINRASLSLFADFFDDVQKSLTNRQKLARLFQQELKSLGFEVQESKDNVFCYLSALAPQNMIEQRDEIVRKLRRYRVFCTRIWHTPIILNSDAQEAYQINLAEFPNTVEASKRVINFPLQNHYTEKDVRKIIAALKKVMANLIKNQGSGEARFLITNQGSGEARFL
ncbi:MAG: hypothetical protein UU61_C0012G0002 [Parcubacteria group bacterium GW2011_GWB1_41_4]|nr:MAG: hypothetical protein UU61_C0012G0002 [Parcubacteria group bacterium GW2011_GWB1_41_4]